MKKYDVGYWSKEIEDASKRYASFIKDANFVNDIYSSDFDINKSEAPPGFEKIQKRMNMFWANVQTVLPILYVRQPNPSVSRTFNDNDEVGRVASEVLERSLKFIIDKDSFNDAIKSTVLDYVLCGQGINWVRYKADFVKETRQIEAQDELGNLVFQEEEFERVENEDIFIDYIHYSNFLCSDARVWSDVEWVAKREYLTREELTERFGKIGEQVPINAEEKKEEEDTEDKKAGVWEIWCKKSGKVYWYAKGVSELLDEKDDPLELDGFFPCPRPLFGTKTNKDMIAIPDYIQAMTQYQLLDELTSRIVNLTRTLKVKMAYDSSASGINNMFSSNSENSMTPVDGLRDNKLSDVVWSFPIDVIATVLAGLVESRDRIKKDLDEITGISDVIRGQSVPADTATATRIKGQFASIRIKDKQDQIARYVRDLIQICGEVACKVYSLDTFKLCGDFEGLDNDDKMLFPDAFELLKDGSIIDYRIDVETDDMIQSDEASNRADRIEFLTAINGFMKEIMPMMNSSPEMAELAGKLLLFGVRGFKAGRELEGSINNLIEKTIENNQPSKTEPDIIEAITTEQQAMAQREIAVDNAKTENDIKLENIKAANEVKINALKEVQDVYSDKAKRLNDLI